MAADDNTDDKAVRSAALRAAVDTGSSVSG
jgi:hypothetical protein